MKEQGRVKRYIDSDIKVGDFVKLVDGSAFTIDFETNSKYINTAMYIIDNYEDLGFSLPLKKYDFKVIETNVVNWCSVSNLIHDEPIILYLQDILIECNGVRFRTASKMVKKIESSEKYTNFTF